MIKLFAGKDKAKPEEKKSTPTKSPGLIRLQRDLGEVELAEGTKLEFPQGNDNVQGFYRGGTFAFTVTVPDSYPHDPPKVHCDTMVYHPNIDWDGNVCLNILREDWKPVLSVSAVVYGLQHLFSEPNPDDPLNKEAAEVLRENRHQFHQNVLRSLRGGYVGDRYFPKQI